MPQTQSAALRHCAKKTKDEAGKGAISKSAEHNAAVLLEREEEVRGHCISRVGRAPDHLLQALTFDILGPVFEFADFQGKRQDRARPADRARSS